MSKKIATLQDLISRIEASVQSKNITKDYTELLSYCRELKISSYVLNILIQKAKEAQQEDKTQQKVHDLFINYTAISDSVSEQNKIQTLENRLSSLEIEKNTYLQKSKNKQRTWTIIICLTALFTTYFIFCQFIELAKAKDRANLYAQKADDIQNAISILSNQIINIHTEEMDTTPNGSFGNWISTNNEPGSVSRRSYKFYAYKGDTLTYKYRVSSEKYYDYLQVTLSGGENLNDHQLTKASGIDESTFEYEFPTEGCYTITMTYNKDHSYSHNKDRAWVQDINVKHSQYVNKLIEVKNYCDSIIKNINN